MVILPLDFSNNTTYSIDYQSLLTDISRSFPPIFSNSLMQEEYFLNWIEILQKCDKYICDNNDFYRNMCAVQNEIFEQEITFSKSTLKIYFSIENAIKFTQVNKMEPQTILCHQLLEDNWLQWTPVNSFDSVQKPNIPIIACYFPLERKRFLLIDGNKRLSYAICRNLSSIKMFMLTSNNVLDGKILLSPFERCYYSMIMDLLNLLTIKQNSTISLEYNLFSFSKLPKEKSVISFL